MNANPIIIALDFDYAAEARSLVDALGDEVGFLQSRHGTVCRGRHGFCPRAVARGKNVFLDMKFYDIGETVKRAVAR